MFKCYECGKTFLEPKIITDKVPYGEGYVPLNTSSCPHCNGSFDMAYPCKDCEEYFFVEELHNDYCIDCIKENFDDPEDLFEFSEQSNDKNCINEFALEMFGGYGGINAILKILLKFIYYCNPEMIKTRKNKFIEESADELSKYWENKYGKEFEIF